jgi:hypothetical protein
MDNACYLRNCSLLTGMAPGVKNLCQVPVTVEEELDGCKFRWCKRKKLQVLIIADVVGRA